jgi:hypothetical protein
MDPSASSQTAVMGLHDAEVVSIEHRRDSRGLSLGMHGVKGEKITLVFSDVMAFRLDGFREQNVVLELRRWPAGLPGTAERCHDLGIVPELVREGFDLFEVEASVGLEGWIIAGDVRRLTRG